MNLPAIFVNILDRVTDKKVNRLVPSEGISVTKDVVYNATMPKLCVLDIYRKESLGRAKLPVIVNIHGGSFVASARHFRRGFCNRYAARGYCVLNLDYPLAPKVKYAEMIAAVYPVMEFVKNEAETYGFDTEKVIICGDSAGGYLATAMCTLATSEDCRKAYNLPECGIVPKAALLFCGVYNPRKLYDQKMILNQQVALGKLVFGVSKERDMDSESFQKTNLTAFLTEKFPPVFINHTDTDDMCPAQGKLMVAALKNIGIPTWEFHAVTAYAVHDWQLSSENPSSNSVHDAALNFLDDALNGEVVDKYFEI